MSDLDKTDRALAAALCRGLPITQQPYRAVAEMLKLEESEVTERLEAMLDTGAIRRIAAVPNHYRMGVSANGMSVWDLDDEQVDRLGPEVGALDFVTHCYRRPRRLPDWPYNLFAMVHGSSRDEVEEKVERIAELLGEAARAHDILYSTRILKKTGMRFGA